MYAIDIIIKKTKREKFSKMSLWGPQHQSQSQPQQQQSTWFQPSPPSWSGQHQRFPGSQRQQPQQQQQQSLWQQYRQTQNQNFHQSAQTQSFANLHKRPIGASGFSGPVGYDGFGQGYMRGQAHPGYQSGAQLDNMGIGQWEQFYEQEHPYAKLLRQQQQGGGGNQGGSGSLGSTMGMSMGGTPGMPGQSGRPRSYYEQYQQSQGGGMSGGGMANGSAADPNDPLANKVMVLYYGRNPQDQASQQALQIVEEFKEILAQDAHQVYPRPAWLRGTPTVVVVRSKKIYTGQQALVLLQAYTYHQKLQGGAQRDVVINPSVGHSTGGNYSMPFEDNGSLVPVGASNTSGNVSEVQETEDDTYRYLKEGRVDQSDLEAYMQRRQIIRRRPAKWVPSTLGDGLVSM